MKKLIFILFLFSYGICSAQTYDLNAKVSVTTATNNGAKAMTLTELKLIVNNWSLTGNSGTTAGTNFLGTTDNVPLVFKQNNVVSGIINNALNSASLGYNSLPLTSTGNYNTAIGQNAGRVNTSGNQNSFIGFQSGNSNTTGSFNNFIGVNAGSFNINGNYNIFIGNQTGYLNTLGSQNSFIGFQSGYSNTSGSQNSFIGYQSGYSNTSGSQNSFIGLGAGYSDTTGSQNSFIGNQSGYSNTSGNYNSFIGYQSGYSNTSGSQNSFIGFQSGNSNTNGTYNNFIGVNAGSFNTIGIQNSFTGNQTGYLNISGNGNSFSGYQAGYNNTTGSNNNLFGIIAGISLKYGSNNTYIGVQSLGVVNEAYRSGLLAIGNSSLTYISGDSAGNIGIGTNTPSNRLDVSGTFHTKNGTGGDNFLPYMDNNNYLAAINHIFRDQTNNNELMRLVGSSGNLGINTTAPSYKLDINASTNSTGNPIRVQGLQPGSTSDSIVSSNNGVLRRLAISDIVTGTTIPYVYSNSAGSTTLADATTTTVVWGLVTDIVGNNAVSSTATTGTFDTYVCQKTGVVRLSGAFDITPGTATTAISNLDVFATTYLSDGTTIVDSKLIGGYTIPNGSTARISGTFSGSSYTTVGQKIKIRVFQNTGNAITLSGGAACSLMVTQ